MRALDVRDQLTNVAIQAHVLGALELLLGVDEARDDRLEDGRHDLTLGVARQTRAEVGGVALAPSCFIISANIRNQRFYTSRSFMI